MSNPAKESSPTTRARRPRLVEQLSWHHVDADLIKWFMAQCVDDGAAVLFTRTRDGGTLVAQVLSGDNKLKEYMPSYSEVEQVLNWLLDDMQLAQYTKQASSK